ncbi:MAG TPA: NAD(P)-dependent oxidoreductase [Candidatus Bathyarchaeia archaeon]|nr:NAD(P)-dependent oxidoreductase [Candidatus Bathyarchaeia archaeon]
MSTVFVTGASGFVGSHLVRRLVQEGFDVHVLCRRESTAWRIRDLLPQLRVHTASLVDAVAMRQVLRAARPDYVFHLGAATMVAGAVGSADDLVEVNLLGTMNLIEACEVTDYRGLVITGDSFEYSPSDQPLRERSACQPSSPHGASKLAATLFAEKMARDRHHPIVTLRLFSTYGPGDDPRRFVPQTIAGALTGMPIALSRPDIVRDWVYVEDLPALYLEAAARAATLSGSVFNAGSGRGASLGEMVDRILGLTGSRAPARWGTFAAPEHDRYPWVADMTRTHRIFAWRPRTSLEKGLAATIQAMREAA